jgi:hypothetical protein
VRREILAIELDAAVRLAENLLRGGYSDPEERDRKGTEALVLTSTLGPDRVPDRWKRVAGSDEEIQAALIDPEMPDWKKEALEAQLAANAILRDLRRLT